MEKATVCTQCHNPSIEFPMGFQLDASEFYLKRIGRSILLIPIDVDPWDLLSQSLNEFTSDFMEERVMPCDDTREALFE
jgi:virulence-associated protein VagC